MKATVGRSRIVGGVLTAVAGVVLAPAASAWAQQPPETFTYVSTTTDHFSGPGSFLCQDEDYDVTVTGRMVIHLTYFPDTDTAHVLSYDYGAIVAVPVDGTGPTYRGHFWDQDSDNVRVVKGGDILVEKDTDLFRSVAHGSDGSRAFAMMHAQLTVNANGETTVQYAIDKMVCR
jgi:hypothetical protein